ncbi:MAG: PaaI family thioesterase, partial [Alistipes sp.]|nr:PaaI family thioesterase [Alistipes sp.]
RKFQTSGVTSRMEVKYKKPVMITDAPIELRARVVEQKRNVLDIAVELRDVQGELCTTANCIYFLFPKDRAKEEFGLMEFKTEDEL